METNENLTEKLKFIGLDLENVPDKLVLYHNINCRMRRNYTEKKYKVYKFINVDEIDVFLTPTHRLTDYTEKYAKALPLGAYLYTDSDENLEKNVEFLQMLKGVSVDSIKEIEKKQKEFNKEIPYNVNYKKDYLWQIYYSDTTKRYFMLVPMFESENEALFYLIKKQLEEKKQKIYVPICYAEYSNKFLTNDQIADLEDYMAYFTKDWPLVYEVYNEENNMSLQIVGKTTIYDTIKSEYKLNFQEQGETENFYKLVKALFILETQLSHYYKFNIQVDKSGKLNFVFNGKEINFEDLIYFIKDEYVAGLEKTIKAKEQRINLEKELKNLKAITQKLDEDYFAREKQISTFLECKKSFFGRVKYFVKYKKKKIEVPKEIEIKKEEKNKLKYCERLDVKENYTLEELLALYTNLEKETVNVNDIELDIEAANERIDTLTAKIKNADLYIKEIDKHKKSIFEFWRFTNKDDAKQLNAGTVELHLSKKIKKTFNYELDFEDVAKQMDKKQRELFSKEDTDNIFIATTKCITDINNVLNGKNIEQNRIDELKEEAKNMDTIETFDLFGSISSAGEKIKTLGNIKHRENEKNKFSILKINDNITIETYEEKIKKIKESLEENINKFKNEIEFPIYKVGKIEDGFNLFYMSPESAINNSEGKDINLNKIILKENTKCLACTNIMYYNNANQTLPLGMHVTDGIIINVKEMKLKQNVKLQNYVINTNEDSAKHIARKINISEYEIC